MYKVELSSTLYNFIDAIDGLQQVSHVTAQGFYQVWGHKPMCKNDDLPSHGAARQPRQPLKIVQSRAERLSEKGYAWAKRLTINRDIARLIKASLASGSSSSSLLKRRYVTSQANVRSTTHR